MLGDLDDVVDPPHQSVNATNVKGVYSPAKDISDLCFQQAATAMPVPMLEFTADSNSYMLPVAGYLSQQGSDGTEDFSTSTCVPLIPLSSVLVPVSDGVHISGGDGIEYSISSIYENYGCTLSSNQSIPMSSVIANDVSSSVAENAVLVDTQASVVYPVDSTPLTTSLLSFIQPNSSESIEPYQTVSTSAKPITTNSVIPSNPLTCKKRGRPRKITVSIDPELVKTASETQPYHPSHFWCPLCDVAYVTSTCPTHPISIEADNVVPSYARLTLPAGLELVDESETVKVMCKRRWPPCTRFGPVVAPTVTEAELQAHPDWWPSCPFRLDPVDESEPVRYLKLSDESVCNWMMFVRREEIPKSTTTTNSNKTAPVRHRKPNCVAYQFGTAGVFFLTTKAIRPGEELLVTLAPPYAIRSHARINGQSESYGTSRPTADQSRSSRSVPPDEIHCFRCTITFDSEEAFRVHCLGHPDESALRGFTDTDETATNSVCSQTHADGAYILLRKPSTKNGAELNSESRTVYFRSTLQCSLCFTTFKGLLQLVQHTNTVHSVSKPRIFKQPPHSPQALISPYLDDMADELVTVNELDSERLIVKSGSLYDFRDQGPPSVSSAENFIVVDLTNASQNLLEQTFWAYGCGQCKQRFPSMLALEQHKDTLHNALNPTSISVSQQFQLDELLPHTYAESFSAVSVTSGDAGAVQLKDSVTQDTYDCGIQSTNETCDIIPANRAYLDNMDAYAGSTPDENQHNLTDSISSRSNSVPLICRECFKDFRTRSALAVHVRSGTCSTTMPSVRTASNHTGLPRLSRYGGRIRPRFMLTTRREFLSCVVCGERFSTRHSWNAHHVKHRRPTDRLYPCELCTGSQEKAYETFEQLRRHMRQVHTNQVFPCPYCDCTFGRRKNLNNHLTRHTGRRDFICPHDGCQKAYSRKDKLKTHMKSHHDKSRLTPSDPQVPPDL